MTAEPALVITRAPGERIGNLTLTPEGYRASQVPVPIGHEEHLIHPHEHRHAPRCSGQWWCWTCRSWLSAPKCSEFIRERFSNDAPPGPWTWTPGIGTDAA